MASGSLSGRTTYNGGYQFLGASWWSSSDINSNTSKLTINLYWSTSNTSRGWDTVAARDAYIKVYVNGVETFVDIFSMRFNCNPYPANPYVFRTFTCTIGHNADGSPPVVQIAAYANGTAKSSGTNWGPGKSYVDAQSIYLDTIPRTSSFSYSGTTLGSATTVNINRASASFTHTVIYTMGNVSQSYGGVATSVSFTRPYTDANQFGANSASGTGTITVITYNGGQEIGRTAQYINMTLPDNNDTKPVKNSDITISDSNSAISEKFGKFIQGNTRLLFGFDFTARYGATIREYNLIINDENLTNASNSILTGVLKSSGNINYTYKVKDSRGRTYTESGVVPVSEYNKPIINVEIERTSEGNAAQVHITATITALDNKNDKIASIRYKPHNSQEAYVSEVVQFDDGYTLDKTINIPIAEDVSYDFYATVSDFFATEQTSIVPISTVYDLLHFRNDGEGIAIGKRSETKGFEVAMDMYYKGQTLEDYIKSVIDNYR